MSHYRRTLFSLVADTEHLGCAWRPSCKMQSQFWVVSVESRVANLLEAFKTNCLRGFSFRSWNTLVLNTTGCTWNKILQINFFFINFLEINTDHVDVWRAVVCKGNVGASGRIDALLGVRNCVVGIEAHQFLISSRCEFNWLEEGNGDATVPEEGPGLQECQLLQLSNKKRQIVVK